MSLSISEMFNAMQDELEKFQEDSNRKKDLKLIIDFDSAGKLPKINQIQIEGIKYKKRIVKKKSIVDLKDRNKNDDNALF
jgi:hypothetical protein